MISFEEVLETQLKSLRKYNPVADNAFGLELELEGRLLNLRLKSWSCHHEGSILDGQEYVSIPLTIGKIRTAIYELHHAMDEYGMKHRPSYRTSTHIHLNYQHASLRTLVNSVIIWAFVEPVMMKICGPTRDGNLFCLPSYHTRGTNIFLQQLFKYCVRPATHSFPEGHRYSAQNLAALKKFGTVEYRCFPESLNENQIFKWCSYVYKIKKCAEGYKQPFTSIAKELYHNPLPMLEKVFGTDLPYVGGPTTLRDLTNLGCTEAYEIATAIEAMRSWLNRTVAAQREEEEELKRAIEAEDIFLDQIAQGDENEREDEE